MKFLAFNSTGSRWDPEASSFNHQDEPSGCKVISWSAEWLSFLSINSPTNRASYLDSCLPSCNSVRPAASRLREQTFYWLLGKHRQIISLLLMISLSLFTRNYFVISACPGVSIPNVCMACSTISKPSKNRSVACVNYPTRTEMFYISDPPPRSSIIFLPR
jgi:hypothetical protein